MDGEYLEAWDDITKWERKWNPGDQKKKFTTMCKTLCKTKLGNHALNNQKEAMEAGLDYDGHNHGILVERHFQINSDLDLFGEDAKGYSLRDMARKIIPKNLKPSAKLKYIDKGGKELRDKQDILDMMETITEVLEVEHDISRERNNRDKSNHSNIPGRNPD